MNHTKYCRNLNHQGIKMLKTFSMLLLELNPALMCFCTCCMNWQRRIVEIEIVPPNSLPILLSSIESRIVRDCYHKDFITIRRVQEWQIDVYFISRESKPDKQCLQITGTTLSRDCAICHSFLLYRQSGQYCSIFIKNREDISFLN